jgi:SAM-dependent methyltransferase
MPKFNADAVRRHYGATGLVERLKTALAVFGAETVRLTPPQLAALDQFHTRGLTATAELAKLADLKAGQSLLDIGCGLGGPARFLADTQDCRVTGIDLNENFILAARYLTERTGQSDRVSFQTASALALPFTEGGFDGVLLQHVAMNIADRDLLYGEVRRVLRPGGKFVTYDVVAKDGEPYFPLPWARSPETSFLLSTEHTRAAIAAAGFQPLVWQDDSKLATDWIAGLGHSGPPSEPNLGLVMGPDFFRLVANLGRNLQEGRLGVISAVFTVPSTEDDKSRANHRPA